MLTLLLVVVGSLALAVYLGALIAPDAEVPGIRSDGQWSCTDAVGRALGDAASL